MSKNRKCNLNNRETLHEFHEKVTPENNFRSWSEELLPKKFKELFVRKTGWVGMKRPWKVTSSKKEIIYAVKYVL